MEGSLMLLVLSLLMYLPFGRIASGSTLEEEGLNRNDLKDVAYF
jgi:cellobiose-specific phosphotransferase system component IIC